MKKILSIIIISVVTLAIAAWMIYDMYVAPINSIGGDFKHKLIAFVSLTFAYAVIFATFTLIYKLLKWAYLNLFDDNN